jgi:hypothetical protein
MELSVKDEQRWKMEEQICSSAVAECIQAICDHLEAAANATYEIRTRLNSGNLSNCRKTIATQLACGMLDGCDVDITAIVSDICDSERYELVDDEQLIDRVRQEVSRRVDGLSKLLG